MAQIMVTDNNGHQITIGRAQSFEVKLDNNVDFLNELGNEGPAEIIEGVTKITGTLEEAMINFNMFDSGIQSIDPTTGIVELPYLSISGTLQTNFGPVTIIVSGVKIDSIEMKVSLEDKWLKGTYPFHAISLQQL
jgi:hypothetical protein